MSKNIRFEFKTIFECRNIRKTLKFSNFESNIFSNPTPSYDAAPQIGCVCMYLGRPFRSVLLSGCWMACSGRTRPRLVRKYVESTPEYVESHS